MPYEVSEYNIKPMEIETPINVNKAAQFSDQSQIFILFLLNHL